MCEEWGQIWPILFPDRNITPKGPHSLFCSSSNHQRTQNLLSLLQVRRKRWIYSCHHEWHQQEMLGDQKQGGPFVEDYWAIWASQCDQCKYHCTIEEDPEKKCKVLNKVQNEYLNFLIVLFYMLKTQGGFFDWSALKNDSVKLHVNPFKVSEFPKRVALSHF